jgi:hypothetical protein
MYDCFACLLLSLTRGAIQNAKATIDLRRMPVAHEGTVQRTRRI